MRLQILAPIAVMVCVLLAGCQGGSVSVDTLLPAQVGSYLRTSGPIHDDRSGADSATYQGAEGTVTLNVRWVGRAEVSTALETLPPNSANVGPDPGLGVRKGIFFTFADEYHAAWGNDDWVFVLSASTDATRRAFLAAYGY